MKKTFKIFLFSVAALLVLIAFLIERYLYDSAQVQSIVGAYHYKAAEGQPVKSEPENPLVDLSQDQTDE